MDEVDLPLSVVLGVQGLQVDEDLGERFEFRTPCLYCTPVLFSQILIVYPVLVLGCSYSILIQYATEEGLRGLLLKHLAKHSSYIFSLYKN